MPPEPLLWHPQTSLWMGAAVHFESGGDKSSCVSGISLSRAQEAVWTSLHKSTTAAHARGRGCFIRESFQAGESQSHMAMVTALCHSCQRSQHQPNFHVLCREWGTHSLWFPPAAQKKSHICQTTLSTGLWGGKDGRAVVMDRECGNVTF